MKSLIKLVWNQRNFNPGHATLVILPVIQVSVRKNQGLLFLELRQRGWSASKWILSRNKNQLKRKHYRSSTFWNMNWCPRLNRKRLIMSIWYANAELESRVQTTGIMVQCFQPSPNLCSLILPSGSNVYVYGCVCICTCMCMCMCLYVCERVCACSTPSWGVKAKKRKTIKD